MNITKDSLGAFLFLVFSLAYGFYAWQIVPLPIEARDAVTSSTLPKIYAGLGALFSLLALVLSFTEAKSEAKGIGFSRRAMARTAALLGLMLLYALAMEPLGFMVATLAFLLAGYWVMGERRIKVLLLASVPVVVLFWLVMTRLLGIYLVSGSLWS